MAFEYAVVLTGGIATGKSTVAKFFSFTGFMVIDADSIAHKILDEQRAVIAEMFGSNFVKKNRVKRKKLGKMIFADNQKREQLEALLHPLIFEEIKRLSTEEDKFKKPYLIDIPLFFETKRYPIEKSLVVYAPEKIQVKRLILREGYTKKEAKMRINSQIDIEKKRKLATYVINNVADLTNLKNECKRVQKEIIKDFA